MGVAPARRPAGSGRYAGISVIALRGLPQGIAGWMSTRSGGASQGMYTSLNLGDHVGDDADSVAQNRRVVENYVACPLAWLNQVHGTDVIYRSDPTEVPQADAQWTDQKELGLCIGVADCLPVGFARQDASAVAVAHAGWRGLCGGVLENTAQALGGELLACLGPCIGPRAFQVGPEVRDAFCDLDAASGVHFVPDNGKYLADLRGLAKRRLAAIGIPIVSDLDQCTVEQPERWFSYRRQSPGGRMAMVLKVQSPA